MDDKTRIKNMIQDHEAEIAASRKSIGEWEQKTEEEKNSILLRHGKIRQLYDQLEAIERRRISEGAQ